MELLLVNLSKLATRTERHAGRQYLVAPMTLIVPGVLNGSDGPLYYPPDEVARDPAVWNHMPIVVNHPSDNMGRPITARQPSVLERYGVGTVYNAGINDSRLIAEGWFDTEKLRQVDNRVLDALKSGKPVELSTGLFLDRERAPQDAVHNGKPYTFTTRNYRPDHLAILPDKKGACSIDDGCGVLNHTHEGKPMKEIVDYLITNCACWSEEDRETLNAMSEDKLKAFKSETEKAKAQEAVVNAAKKGFTDPAGSTHVWNADAGKWESKIAKAKEDEPEPKKAEPTTNKTEPVKQLTLTEYLKQHGTDEERAVWNSAVEIEKRERVALSKEWTDLVSNIEDESLKNILINELPKMSIQALRLDIAKMKSQKPASKDDQPVSVLNFLGSATPATNHKQNQLEPSYEMVPPEMDWSNN